MKNLFYLLFTLIVISCTSEQPLGEGKYRINGVVTGLENGEIYLTNHNEFVTVKVENGKFTFEKELTNVVDFLYIFKDSTERMMTKESVLKLYIEPTDMNLSLDYDNFKNSKLSGSSTHDDQYRLDNILESISSKYQKELDELDAIMVKYDKAYENGASEDELEAIKYEDNEVRDKLHTMWIKQGEASLKFVKDNPKSFVSVSSFLFLINDLKYNEAKAILDSFDPVQLKTEIGKQIVTEVENLQKGVPGALQATLTQ